jgi:short-subunit dehydrogenase
MNIDHTYTLITGASLGLGREFAIACAKRGMNLLLVSLPGENLPAFGKELSDKHEIDVMTYEYDLTKKEAIFELIDHINNCYSVNMIINNAGFGGCMHFEVSSPEYLDNMIQLNIRAVSLIIRLMIPELMRHQRSWIMNVSSMAAFSPMPYKTIYPASKAFVYSFSRGLAEELKNTPIRISIVNPGPIMTNDEVISRINKQGYFGKLCVYEAEYIATTSLNQMLKGKRVIVPGFPNKVYRLLLKLVPLSIRLRFLSKVFRRELIDKTAKSSKLHVA